MTQARTLSSLVQQFFSDYLINQRKASSHTVASYRDSFSLLLHYAQDQYRRPAAGIELVDLNARFIAGFLSHLENDRGACIRSRNQRLAAIRSFFHYIALYVPEHIELIQQVLAIPAKRYQRRLIAFLNHEEITCLLRAPDRGSWIGRRDHALLMLMVQTGLRISELTRICCGDLNLSCGPYVHCTGKGRKDRCTPLTKQMVKVLKAWLVENEFEQADPLFPSTNGGMMSADAVQYLLNKHVTTAGQECPSLTRKRVSPHVLRHTAAMQLLDAGIDHVMIALWLGHESVETTQIYLEASLALKEKLLKSFSPVPVHRGRFVADDQLLSFLRAI
jgi:site-specific recombinase XerD